jgi:hypothetical protein
MSCSFYISNWDSSLLSGHSSFSGGCRLTTSLTGDAMTALGMNGCMFEKTVMPVTYAGKLGSGQHRPSGSPSFVRT